MQPQDQGILASLWHAIKEFFRSAVRTGMEEGFQDFQQSIKYDDIPALAAPTTATPPGQRAIPFQNNGQGHPTQTPVNGQPQPGDEPRRRGRRPNNPQGPLFPPVPGQPQQQ